MARALVIDDDNLFIKLITHTLIQKGFEVDSALDGKSGYQQFTRQRYDVVVCDIVMPEQEGVETIQLIRQHRPGVGIVAISGGLGTSSMQQLDVLKIVEKLGADVSLKKPFQLSALVEAVDAAMTKHKLPATVR